jgi:hypothetical protein
MQLINYSSKKYPFKIAISGRENIRSVGARKSAFNNNQSIVAIKTVSKFLNPSTVLRSVIVPSAATFDLTN